jgi:hypothetical protein
LIFSRFKGNYMTLTEQLGMLGTRQQLSAADRDVLQRATKLLTDTVPVLRAVAMQDTNVSRATGARFLLSRLTEGKEGVVAAPTFRLPR